MSNTDPEELLRRVQQRRAAFEDNEAALKRSWNELEAAIERQSIEAAIKRKTQWPVAVRRSIVGLLPSIVIVAWLVGVDCTTIATASVVVLAVQIMTIVWKELLVAATLREEKYDSQKPEP
jgi:hypothetical protein